MSPLRLTTLAISLLAATACAEPRPTDSTPLPPDDDGDKGDSPYAPRTIACVTDPTELGLAEILRVDLSESSDGIRVTAISADLFGEEREDLGSAQGRGSISSAAIELETGELRIDAPALEHVGGMWSGEIERAGEVRAFHCAGQTLAPRFAYEPATGICVDRDGATGLNDTPVALVRELGWGECADLAGAPLNGGVLSYPDLVDYDLRGASLRDAELFFAQLVDADLRGADLARFQFGYAEVTATVDEHTLFPPCQPIDGVIRCLR